MIPPVVCNAYLIYLFYRTKRVFDDLISVSLRYGTDHLSYLTPESFTQDSKQNNHVIKLIRTLKANINYFYTKNPHPAICHFIRKYNQIPFWGLNTIMSFGTMANFYDLLVDDLKKKIAHEINPNLTPKKLSSILYYLTSIRNKCAHNNRLYTHKIDQMAKRTATIPKLSIHNALSIPPSPHSGYYCYGQDDILAVLICIVLLFGQTHLYQIQYDAINKSITDLKEKLPTSTVKFVRETTGLKDEYLQKLKLLNI